MSKLQSKPMAWALLGILTVFAGMIVFNIHPIQDPDIWWHLASGRYMMRTMTLPKTDVFSLTARGSPWVNTYWLQEPLWFEMFHHGGICGLTLGNSVLIAIFVTLIGFFNPMHKISIPTRWLGIVWIFLASQPRGYGWGEKASLVTFGFLGLLFYTLRSPHWTQQRRWTYLWPFLFVLWANTHRGFILGLAILTLYVGEAWLMGNSNRAKLALWWGTCITATLINPWGIGVYGMGWQDFRLSPTVAMGWAHTPYFHLELYWFTLLIFWGFMVWEILHSRDSVTVSFLLTSLLLSAVSIRYASLYRYFVIWSVPWILATISRRLPRVHIPNVFVGLFAAGLASLFYVRPAFGINGSVFPVDATQFLINNNIRIPFFHEYGLGGYFMWTLDGKPPVLVDGRYEAVQGYQGIFPAVQYAPQMTPEDFQTFLKNLGLHGAVVKYPSTKFLAAPFADYFPRKTWALIYWDDLVLIFIERGVQDNDLIRHYEFHNIEPDANPSSWLTTVWSHSSVTEKSHLRSEFERNVQIHPMSKRALFWLHLTDAPPTDINPHGHL